MGIAFNADSSQAAIIEVNSETDFVAKNEEFIEFVDKLAKLALDYISFSVSSGHKVSAQVPTEDEMRNIQGAKSRADAARRGKLDDIIKELLKEDM